MGEVISLRRVRRAKAREQSAEAAESARLRHGLAKWEREAIRQRAERAQRDLDGAALSGAAANGDPGSG
jgi:hypothetical protein